MAWRAALVLPECPICQEEQQPGVALGCGNAEHKLCLGCTLRRTRSGCGMMIVNRPSGVVSALMPIGEPLGLCG